MPLQVLLPRFWVASTKPEAALVRGEGRVAEPGLVRVYDAELPYEKLVIATGSVPSIPPIEGLAETNYWTSRQARRGRFPTRSR